MSAHSMLATTPIPHAKIQNMLDAPPVIQGDGIEELPILNFDSKLH